MENLLQDLSDTLKKMTDAYKDVLQTAKDKQKYIISGDIDNLEVVIYQERNLAENILLIEEKRRYILHSINQAIGIRDDDKPPSINELIEKIKGPHKEGLMEIYETIKDIIMKVEVVNRVNASLTKISLNFANNFIKSICSESLNDTVYQKSGEIQKPEFNRVLLEVNI